MLVAAEPDRPVAVTQLQTLAGKIGVTVFHEEKKRARRNGSCVPWKTPRRHLLSRTPDTAGRSQLDDELMSDLSAIREKTTMTETLIGPHAY